MKDNSVIEALALLEHIEGSLKSDSRRQLSRTEMEAAKRLLGQVLGKLTPKGNDFSQINFYLLGAHDLIATVLEDSEFDNTTTETKEMLHNHVREALSIMYQKAGLFYYMDNEFDYYIGIDEILQRIIYACVKAGFYFGQA